MKDRRSTRTLAAHYQTADGRISLGDINVRYKIIAHLKDPREQDDVAPLFL